MRHVEEKMVRCVLVLACYKLIIKKCLS